MTPKPPAKPRPPRVRPGELSLLVGRDGRAVTLIVRTEGRGVTLVIRPKLAQARKLAEDLMRSVGRIEAEAGTADGPA
jgi:hypothetical protein